ncbi:MAG: hypothetical protein U1F34_04725 [Gammaproteobacteria bacterium]
MRESIGIVAIQAVEGCNPKESIMVGLQAVGKAGGQAIGRRQAAETIVLGRELRHGGMCGEQQPGKRPPMLMTVS